MSQSRTVNCKRNNPDRKKPKCVKNHENDQSRTINRKRNNLDHNKHPQPRKKLKCDCKYIYVETYTTNSPEFISEEIAYLSEANVIQINFSYINFEYYLLPKGSKILHMLIKLDSEIIIRGGRHYFDIFNIPFNRIKWETVQDNQVKEYINKLGYDHIKNNLRNLRNDPGLAIMDKVFKEGKYITEEKNVNNQNLIRKPRTNYIDKSQFSKDNICKDTWLYIKTITDDSPDTIKRIISSVTKGLVVQYFCSYIYSKSEMLPLHYKTLYMLIQLNKKITIKSLYCFNHYYRHIHWVLVPDNEIGKYIRKLRFELGAEANYLENKEVTEGTHVEPIY